MRKLKNKEAVSPVIGVILMVAITVAMAAALFFLINNMLGESDTITPDIILSKTTRPEMGLQVVKADFGITWDDVDITNGIPPSGGVVTAGNFIVFDDNGSSDTLTMVYGPTNALIGSWQFGAISPSGDDDDDVPPPTVTRELSTEAGFSGVQEGDLLVVIANTRTGTYTTGGITASASGFTHVETASFMTTSSNRRAVTILTKTADGTESGSVTVSFTGSGVSTYETHYQVFRMTDGTNTWTTIANGANDGTGSAVGSLPASSTTLPGGSTANVLSIGAMVSRDNPGSVSFSGLTGTELFDYNDAYSATAYDYGRPVTASTVTLPTSQMASGLLIQIEAS